LETESKTHADFTGLNMDIPVHSFAFSTTTTTVAPCDEAGSVVNLPAHGESQHTA